MIERFRERLPLIRPLFVPLILYIGLLALAMTMVENFPQSPWRYAVALSPMLPGFFLAAGVVRMVIKLDELSRKVILESLAIGFAATMILLLGLGLLEAAGMESPGSIYIALFMGMVLIVAKLVLSRRYE
jgi:hypothetical protein